MQADVVNHHNLESVAFYESCLSEFQALTLNEHKKFYPKDLRDGLKEALLNQDFDSSSLILKEISKYICKSNQRAIWKAGMFIGLMHPNSTNELMDTLCESALHFCETLRSEVVLEHMIFYTQKRDFKKAIDIAEKLDKPRPGVKKRHENPMNEFESYRNCVILDLIKYYKAMAELGYAIDSIYQSEGTMIRLPSLLKGFIPDINPQSKLNFMNATTNISSRVLVNSPSVISEENVELNTSNISSGLLVNSPSVISKETENIEEEGSAFLASQISGLLESWDMTIEAIKQDPIETIAGPEDDYQSDIAASFLGLLATPSPSKQNSKARKTTLGGKLSKSAEKRRKKNRDQDFEVEQVNEIRDSNATTIDINGRLVGGSEKRLAKVCQSFENCLSTIRFVPENENFTQKKPYIAWDTFVDLHIGILLYVGNLSRAKEVLDHFITLYPSYYPFHEMACNLYSSYPQHFHNSASLLKQHQQILLEKDSTNPRIIDLCHHLFEEQDYRGAATYLFNYMDCMNDLLTSQITNQVQSLLVQLANVCHDYLLLKRDVDELWQSQSYRSATWIPNN